jgi:large subunit ribosomal protein L24
LKIKIKKNDTVIVRTGKDKGKKGQVIRVISSKNKAIVEGVNMITRHVKSGGTARQTGLVQQEAPIDISNLIFVDSDSDKAGKIGFSYLDDGSKVRVVKNRRS